MSQQLGSGHTFAVDADELEDFGLRNELPAAEVEKARGDLERARGRGFEHCQAVFVEYAYDGLLERASPTDGRLNWGRGQQVVDRHYFRDGQLVPDPAWLPPPPEREWEAYGLGCMVILTDLGHRCGYVRVPADHVLHGVGYNQESPALTALLSARLEKPIGEDAGMGVLLAVLSGEVKARPDIVFEVHGGLTFAGTMRGRGAEWWFGFDCAHDGDASSPEKVAEDVRRYGHHYRDGGHHWTADEVAAECERLAAQLAALRPDSEAAR